MSVLTPFVSIFGRGTLGTPTARTQLMWTALHIWIVTFLPRHSFLIHTVFQRDWSEYEI